VRGTLFTGAGYLQVEMLGRFVDNTAILYRLWTHCRIKIYVRFTAAVKADGEFNVL
jgi:hypothetical protein